MSTRAVAGPHHPWHCGELIQSVQGVRSDGRERTADGMGVEPLSWGGRERTETVREEDVRKGDKSARNPGTKRENWGWGEGEVVREGRERERETEDSG